MCSFVDSVFFIRGCNNYNRNRNNDIRKSCVVFETNTKKWIEVAKLNDFRIEAACTVFEGRVVVSGGTNSNENLRSVEAYDHVADKWSYMPNMINEIYGHELVPVSNKLFALGRYFAYNICEVYDSICKEFVVIKSHPTFLDRSHHTSISVGRKILVFKNYSTKVAVFDVDKNEWSEESFEVTKCISNFHCLKIPSFKF